MKSSSTEVGNPWPLPFQWYGFYSDGYLVSMAKTEYEDHSESDLEKIFSILKENSPRYRWEGDFIVVEYPDQPGRREIWGMNIFRKDVPRPTGADLLKSSDLVMSLAGGDEGRPVYFRHLRRVLQSDATAD